MAKNQCDGCARGLKIYRGAHVDDVGMPVIGCTALLYDPRPNILGQWVCPGDYADPVYTFKSLSTGKPLYCFFDEMWIEIHGPYYTEEACREACTIYGNSL